ncbi:MAG: hypothetical protein QF437_06565 [Planctomycetota bacterium]|nr:hypothetical protein [Planctomycetota bacterium]
MEEKAIRFMKETPIEKPFMVYMCLPVPHGQGERWNYRDPHFKLDPPTAPPPNPETMTQGVSPLSSLYSPLTRATQTSQSIMTDSAIPFETFAGFERVPGASPLFSCAPPDWAAAAHAIVVDETVHYIWAQKRADDSWVLMHSSAPASDPSAIEHDPRNPIVVPAGEGAFDDHAVEYPFPFLNPAHGRYYMYYLGKRQRVPKQTGLMVMDGDFGTWRRVSDGPVIPAEYEYEEDGSSHPSVAVDGDVIHIVYTGEAKGLGGEHHPYNNPTLCHATAPTSDPACVTKDAANPVFKGSGEAWDRYGVRETEILRGPSYFHIFYGGYNGSKWQLGHVRTIDFRTFEPNPANPIFAPNEDPEAWDSGELLTPQVFELNGDYYMLYAGLKGRGWGGDSECGSGLAVARKS